MIDMDIKQNWVSGPTSRRVNIFSASKSWTIFDVDFFDFEKMRILDFVDIYSIFFDINSQCLVGFSQYFVKTAATHTLHIFLI